MTERTTIDPELDQEAIARVARPSTMPPPAALAPTEGDGEEDGKLDLRALASSMAPPAPETNGSHASLPPAAAIPSEMNEARLSDAEANAKAEEARAEAAKADAAKADAEAKKAAAEATKAQAEAKTAEARASMAPPPSSSEDKKKGGFLLPAIVGAALAGGAVFAATNAGGPDEGTPVAMAPEASAPTGSSAVTPTPAPEPPAPAEAAPTEAAPTEAAPTEAAPDEAAAEAAAEEAAPEADAPPAESAVAAVASAGSGSARREAASPSTPRADRASAPAEAAMAAPEPAPMEVAAPSMDEAAMVVADVLRSDMQSSTRSTAMSSIDDLLAGATAMEETMAATAMAAPAADSNLPDTPSRSTVTRVMGGLTRRIRSCAGEQVGMAIARVTVKNDGSVQSANIGNAPFAGTPQGACMQGVIRGASFPPFRRNTFNLSFPYNIR